MSHLAVAAAAGRVQQVEQLLALTPWRDGGARLRSAYKANLVGYDVVFEFGFEKETAS